MTNLPATAVITNSPVSAYLAAHGVGMTGTFFKFDGKEGKFVTSQDDTEIPEGSEYVVIYDQIQAGWVKFAGKGAAPDGSVRLSCSPRSIGNLQTKVCATYCASA